MLILSFDTTASGFSVALLRNQKLLTKKIILENGKQAEFLIPEIEQILRQNKIWYSDLNLIAATQGPGSFTGVRIGLTVARSLKIATNLPLILIDSLESLTFKYRNYSGEIFTAIDAKMDEFFIAKFLAQNGKISQTSESQLIKQEDVLNFLPKNNFLLCGSGKKIISEILTKKNLLHEINNEEDQIDPETIALLALEKLQNNNFQKNYDPLYLRDPRITARKK